MPELPEIIARSKEMNSAICGRRILSAEISQPKCLNMDKAEFRRKIKNANVIRVYQRGKWIFTETDKGHILINLGMGGEILLTETDKTPLKKRAVFVLSGEVCISVNFWWFGYIHYAKNGELFKHKETAKLGTDADKITFSEFKTRLEGRRGNVKSFLLDQKNIAGIGNAYIHDILFFAKLHPKKKIQSLDEVQIKHLHEGIKKGLIKSIRKGGAFYETDIFGKPGGFKRKDIVIGYRKGEKCPVCRTVIEKIKTGSTSSFICPECQKE